MRIFRTLLGCVLVLGAGLTAYAAYPPFRLFVLAVSGRSPVCPVAQAVKSAENRDELTRIKDRILHASHLVREDSQAGLELWSTPKGEFWIPKGNRYTLPFNLAEMERKVYGSGDHFVHPGDVVLDCGASDGDFSRDALQAGAKLVVAVEIAPKNIECLRRNLAAEIAAGRAIVYPKGVWDKDDVLTLNEVEDNFAANSVVMHPEGARRGVTVPLTTIDHIVSELKLAKVDFIKMDVEGAESRALLGARETLTRDKPRLSIAAEHSAEDEVTIPKTIRSVRGDYQMQCGPCLEDKGHIRADVLYLY